MSNIVSLSDKIYHKAKKLNVTKITLKFTGGSDEGYLEIDLDANIHNQIIEDFSKEIEEWAWNVYGYSGAGDGSSYGDNFIYDITNNKMQHDQWYMKEVEEEGAVQDLEIGANWIEDI